MPAVEKNIKGSDFQVIVRLKDDALKNKDQVIARMKEMLEQQATELIQSRFELTACRAQLVAGAVA